MKKLSLYVFLGLFWCNVGHTAKPYKVKTFWYSDDVIVFKVFAGGSDKRLAATLELRNNLAQTHCSKNSKDAYVFKSGGEHDYGYPNNQSEVFSNYLIYYCAKDLEDALKLLVQNPVPSDTYISSLSAVTHYEKNGSEEIFIKTKLKPKISESTDISKIEEYKATCTVLGFELGTDKFADCTLKLFVADNKSNTEIVQSSSGAQEMIIYDPDRERRIKQKRWNDLLHGRCNLNALSKNPC